ncbi:DUF305 domain-containing protein [Phytohabitans flavus]|uniref:DUF305 domain-containing protein n=2 Tax=Phytohabitans flavus TaxID=1076124 RepID=A0A6F8XW11_9ACTN|nr:hypothetical protein Pflav_043990 [Phytohabitans flavus]
MRRAGGVIAVAAALAFVGACGGEGHDGGGHGGEQQPAASAGAGTPADAAGHNDADVEFAQGMIPHHQQAVEMAELAATRAANPKVKELASKIAAAQGPEIGQMNGWLTAWGAPPPATSGGHDTHGSMPGMMSDADMAALEKATGRDFDKRFLEMMIEHHEGALRMATSEQQQGQHPGAKALAQKIEADQTAEIEQMRTMLQSA